MPSIIIEWGFMDSDDYYNFDTEEKLLFEARVIAQGLLSFIGINFTQSSLVDDMYRKDLITDKAYWKDVLSGKLPLNLEYVKIVFDRANKKIK